MADPAQADLLQASGLPQAWAGLNAWRILETRFGAGLHFLRTWQAWEIDPHRPRLLHYVSLTTTPLPLEELLAAAAAFPDLHDLTFELAQQWIGLLPGFHRLTLDGGRVLLTLCVGELTTLLRQQQFVADAVFLAADATDPAYAAAWNIWAIKALARCCRRGTRLVTAMQAPKLLADLKQCGFEIDTRAPDANPPLLAGQFNPRWIIKNTRDPSLGHVAEVATCAVIGAGLAGASIAAALARRGWQVQVLDQGESPAAGASGLPVGLVVPHVSVDDCPLSRMSRSGVRLMLHQARSLLQQGQDWNATGTLEHRVDGTTGLPAHWAAPGTDWSEAVRSDANAHQQTPQVWHRQAAWLKPAQLVKAWLAQPGVTFQGKAQVARLRQSGDEWEVLDESGHVLTRARRVIFANASGARPLIEALQTARPDLNIHVNQLAGMHGMLGQLSWAMHPDEPDAAFPPFPVNGAGSVIPAVPVEGGAAWFIGSSYQPDKQTPLPDQANHDANLVRLNKLIPKLGQVLAQQFATGPLQAWKNTRCVTADRLPMVGPLYQGESPSLWMCAGMGSRGMSFSVLCAELLAAQWGGEPLPLDAGLAQSLHALRGQALAG